MDHLDDLASDFSVFHRVDDIYQLDGPRFLAMAWRISAYEGVMRLRIREQAQRAAPVVDGGVTLLERAEDEASARTLQHALSHVPADAEVVEVAAEDLPEAGR